MSKPRSELLIEKGWLRSVVTSELDSAPITNIYLADYRWSPDGLFTLVQLPDALLELKASGPVQAAANTSRLLVLLQEAALSVIPNETQNELMMFLTAFIQSQDIYLLWWDARKDADQFTPHIVINIHDGTQGSMIFPHLFVSQENIESTEQVSEYSQKIARLSREAYPSLFNNHGMM